MKDILRLLHGLFLYFRTFFKNQLEVKGKTLIIAPHPDDEALGCGGLITHLCKEGRAPHIILMTGGGGSQGNKLNKKGLLTQAEVIQNRRKLTLKSAKHLGLPEENIHFLNFEDGHIDKRPSSEMQRLDRLLVKISPDYIFIPHLGEGWPDHINTRNLILELFEHNRQINIYEYCVWMWYYNIWNLNWKNAVKFQMNKNEHQSKLRAVDAYIKPLAPNGRPWSGVLPKPFIFANTRKTELYFKIK